MKRFAIMFFAPLLAVVVLVAGLGVGQTMSMMTLSGVAGGQVSVNARKKNKECSPDDTVASLSPSDNMKNLATLLLTDPHHIFMGGYDFKDHPAFLMAILGNVANESGFDPRTRQGRGNGKDFEAYTGLSGADDTPPKNDEILPALNRVYNKEHIKGGYAIGLMQWDGARAINLVKFAMGDYTAKGRGHIDADPNGTTTAGDKQVYNPFKEHPKQWYDMDVQAAFIRYELMTTHYDTLNSFRESARVDATGSLAKDHVENLTREFFWKIEFSWPESVYKVYPPTYEAAPKRFGTPEGFKKRVENANKRAADAWSSKKLVDKWAADLHLSLVPLASDPCDVDSGSVEGGSLADFKYDGKLGVGGAVYVQNWRDWVKYGWDDSSSFDAGLLPGSTGKWKYPMYQCTMWTAARLFSLGLTKRLMDTGIAFDSLSTLGNGGQQVGSLGGLGVPTGKSPQVHDVVSFNNGVDQSDKVYGHVGVVEQVQDGGKTFISSEGNACDITAKDCVKLRKHTVQDGMTFAHIEEFLKSKGK